MAGYSGTPLWKKLGFREGFKCCFIDPPENIYALLYGTPSFTEDKAGNADMVLLFTNKMSKLEKHLEQLQQEIPRDSMVWVCWYKKASGKPTELTEDIIRGMALSMDFVDVKVCAIDQHWSGLKLVIRKERR